MITQRTPRTTTTLAEGAGAGSAMEMVPGPEERGFIDTITEFLEEIVDAFNYFLSILVLTGFSADDLMNAYRKKDEIINSRLETGY